MKFICCSVNLRGEAMEVASFSEIKEELTAGSLAY